MTMNGYEEAEKVDKQINELLEKYPISAENAKEWMKFCRTVSTGLDMISELSREELPLISKQGGR